MVEILCELDDAKLLLNRAKLFYPAAVSYIEEGIRLAGKGSSGVPQIKILKTVFRMSGIVLCKPRMVTI